MPQKGALHVHQAVLTHSIAGNHALGFHPEDIFWCTADPGWVTGTSYGIIAPPLHRITNIVDEGKYDALRWCRILAEMPGRQEGCSRGRGGSMHLFDTRSRFYGGNAIVGADIPVAAGLALADRMRGRPCRTPRR